jgi:hypothetical protein
VQEVAKRHLDDDSRVLFHVANGEHFLAEARTRYDLIFADSWAGKYIIAVVAVAVFFEWVSVPYARGHEQGAFFEMN